MKSEALARLVLFGEQALREAGCQYVDHYREERNHQGKGNVLFFLRLTVSVTEAYYLRIRQL